MDFLRAKNFSLDYATPDYAEAVLNGYDPSRLYTPYQDPGAIPILYSAQALQDFSFTLGPSDGGGPGTDFDFMPRIGNSIFVMLGLESVGPGDSLTVDLQGISDVDSWGRSTVRLYYGAPSIEIFDTEVSNYTLAPDALETSFTLTPVTLLGYTQGFIPVVIYHDGSKPTSTGVLHSSV